MRYATWCASLLGFALLLIMSAGSAQAQATRTWVSGVGDDVNPCSRTAPCKTFAGAISKTAIGGLINCIDPGGFGAVTITKSITIDCQNTQAGVLASGTNGINVNGAGIVVNLRGLSIEGAPGTGLIGVNFINGAVIHIENCKIFGFQAGTATGVKFAPPSGVAAELHISNSSINDNGANGVLIQPGGTGSAKVSINRTRTSNNGAAGVRADGTGSTGGIAVSIADSVAAGDSGAGFTSFSQSGSASTKVMINRSMASNNGTGLNANGAAAIMRIGFSVVSGNATAANIANLAAMSSYNNNQIDDNAAAGSAIPTIGLH